MPLSLITFGISLLFVEGYVAISSIAMGSLATILVIFSILEKKIEKSIPNSILISVVLGFLFLCIGLLASKSGYNGSITWIKRWAIFVYCACIFYMLPKQSKKTYLLLILSYIAAIFLIDVYVYFMYFKIIIIDKGVSMPENTWINFIDLMGVYILPFRYTHHTLAFFNVFAIALGIFLLKKLVSIKYLIGTVILCMIFMVHFYSSRMAVLVLYISLSLHLYVSFKESKYKIQLTLIAILLLMISLFGLIKNIPTLNLKTEKLFTEIEFYKISSYEDIKNGPEYRLKSYFIAFEYVEQNFWTGIGLPKMGSAFNHEHQPYPLNNYLYLAVALGVPFALLIMICHFYPFFISNIYSNIGLVIAAFYSSLFFYSLIDSAIIMPVYMKFLAFWSMALQHLKINFENET